METVEVIKRVKCIRCGYEWWPKRPMLPARCPNCGNPPAQPRVYKVVKNGGR